jgi:hypothetical protein
MESSSSEDSWYERERSQDAEWAPEPRDFEIHAIRFDALHQYRVGAEPVSNLNKRANQPDVSVETVSHTAVAKPAAQ